MTAPAPDDLMLSAFLDGELDPTTMELVARRVAAEPALAARAAMFQAADRLLRQAFAVSGQSAAPLAGIVATAPRRPTSAKRAPTAGPAQTTRRGWLALAAASVAGIAVGASGWVALPAGNDRAASLAHTMAEIAEYHSIYTVEREHLAEVPAARKDHIETWLGGRLERPFKIPDLSHFELTFQGGRLLGIDRKPVAQLMYTEQNGSVIALCIVPATEDMTAIAHRATDGGVLLLGRGHGHQVLIVVGPSNNPFLDRIADALPALLFGHS